MLIICWHVLPNVRMQGNAGKNAHFSFAHEKDNKTDSLLPSGCNAPLVIKNAEPCTCTLFHSAKLNHINVKNVENKRLIGKEAFSPMYYKGFFANYYASFADYNY